MLLVSEDLIGGLVRLGGGVGCQHCGFEPDLVSMAKGLSSVYLPISAVGVADHIVEVLRSVGDDFVHGFTYSDHPTSAAVALKNIEIIEREDLVRRPRQDTGPYLAAKRTAISAHPNVSWAGPHCLIAPVEIVSQQGSAA